MSAPIRIIDRIRWRLGIIPDPLPHPKPVAAPTLPIPKMVAPAAGMKEPGTISRILTHGLERNPGVYGALPFSREEVQRSVQEGRNEREEYEKQVTAPIQTYNKTPASTFSAQMNGIGLTDPAIIRDVQEWQRQQRALFADHPAQIDAILPLARGQPAPRIKSGHAL